jgi:cytochrome c oxidase subunit II
LGLVPTTRSRRRLFAAAFLLAVVASLTLAGAAMADALTPESGGSPNADDIDTLYKVVLGVAAVVFVGVEGTLLYSVLRYRKRKGRLAAQIRGNTTLEVGWTVGAALILVVLTAITFIKLPAINDPDRSGPGGLNAGGVLYASVNQPSPPGGRSLNIDVNGQQYVWRFTYPNNAFSYDTMVVPINTTVTLDVRSQDVIHSWWIPKLGGKVDATPGYTNKTWFKVPREGTFEGQCAELCGRNHANMLAKVVAVSVPDYQRWVARQKQLIDQANSEAAQQRRTIAPLPG